MNGAHEITRDPSGTSTHDVQTMRHAGLNDAPIFAITAFVALWIAFSTVDGALGAAPDTDFRTIRPQEVLDAVDYGPPIEWAPTAGS